LAIFVVLSFYVRGFVFCCLGSMYKVIETPFWRFELYFLVTLLIEAPNIFYLYVMHLRSFKEKDKQEESGSETYESLVVVVTNMEIEYQSEYRKRVRIASGLETMSEY